MGQPRKRRLRRCACQYSKSCRSFCLLAARSGKKRGKSAGPRCCCSKEGHLSRWRNGASCCMEVLAARRFMCVLTPCQSKTPCTLGPCMDSHETPPASSGRSTSPSLFGSRFHFAPLQGCRPDLWAALRCASLSSSVRDLLPTSQRHYYEWGSILAY